MNQDEWVFIVQNSCTLTYQILKPNDDYVGKTVPAFRRAFGKFEKIVRPLLPLLKWVQLGCTLYGATAAV